MTFSVSISEKLGVFVRARRHWAAALLCVCGLGWGTQVLAALATEPLLTRAASVRPNLLVLLDTTASMDQNDAYARHWFLATTKGYGTDSTCSSTAASQVNLLAPINNQLAYDPDKRYDPPNLATGALGTAATVTASTGITFYLPKTGQTITNLTTKASICDLTRYNKYEVNASGFRLTGLSPFTITTVAPTTNSGTKVLNFSSTAGVANGMAVSGAGVPAGATVASFTGTTVTMSANATANIASGKVITFTPAAPSYTATNPITIKGIARTDCGGSSCNLVDERKNIANYLAFHKTRFLAMKSGVSRAFATQPDTFRMAWATMNINTGVPGVPSTETGGAVQGPASYMKNFGLAKNDFYTWLSAIDDQGGVGTQIRKALYWGGEYYSNATNQGPWGNCPWVATGSSCPADGSLPATPQGTPAEHLSCRKSYTIVVTDGEYTGGDTPPTCSGSSSTGCAARTGIRDVDIDTAVNALQTITHNDGIQTYRYQPYWSVADARNKGKADKITNTTGFKSTAADIAMYYWGTDLRGASNTPLANDVTPGKVTDRPFWQNMSTYIAGLGVQGDMSSTQYAQARAGALSWTDPVSTGNASANDPGKIDDLVHAAWNGGGEYLIVNNADQFATEIGRVVSSIASDVFSQAGVAASAVTLTAGTKKFVPYYTSGTWWGNLKMLNLATSGDETGTAWQVIGTDTLGKPDGTTTIPSPATRSIYTWSSGSGGISFDLTPMTTNGLRAGSAGANTSTLLVNTMDQATIDFLRGDRSNECDAGPSCTTPMRKRESIMGDIVNSTPVFIKNNSNFAYEKLPAGTPGLSRYDAYKNTDADAKAKRTVGVLFIGANDGMVHGFRESDGRETFAYVPQSVFGNLHLLAATDYITKHRFFVDGPMVETDAYITAPGKVSGSGTRWANLVLGTTGAGARSVFALDVTWPTSMSARSILWEKNQTSIPEIGNVMTEVQSGITANGQWVAIFGNGPNGSDGKGYLMVLDLATGTLLKKIATDSSTGNGLGGVRLVRDAKSMIIGAYAGDQLGRVWRFDLSDTSGTSPWATSGKLLFAAKDAANKAQPITAMPAVIPRTDSPNTGYMVVVGTGKLYDDADQTTTDPQGAYGLWDQVPFGSTNTVTTINSDKSSLIQVSVAQQTGANISTATGLGTNPDGVTKYFNTSASRSVNWATDRGWYINYAITPGQRSIYAVESIQELVRIDTIAPRTSQYSCSASASIGNNLLVDPLTGTCTTRTTLDTNADGVIDDQDATACVYSTEADGEDVVLDVQSNGISTGIVDIQDSRGHFKARVGTPPCSNPTSDPCLCTSTPPASCTPGTSGTRTRQWRQLFMR